MLIGSQQRISDKSFNVSIGGTALKQVDSVRYLGVIIDHTLLWSLHITNIVSRARSRFSSIFHYGTLASTVALFSFCFTIV